MAKNIQTTLTLDNRQFNKAIKQSDTNVDKFSQSGSKAVGVLRALAGAFAIREIINYADGITNLKNKLLTLNPNAEAVAKQFDRIRQIAIASRADLDGVGDLYFRIARAQGELGITSEETAQIVESVSKAITASGLSAQEAAGPLLQLGQALQSGRFQGDELRSILEGLPDVARALARQLGVPIGKLKDLGSQGLITGKVFVDAMRSAKEGIDIAFGNTQTTIGQGFQLVQTGFSGLVNTVSGSTGVFDSIAISLKSIAEFLELLSTSVSGLKAFGTALLSLVGTFLIFGKVIPATTTALANLKTGTFTSVKGFEALTGGTNSLWKSVKTATMRFTGLTKVVTPTLTKFGQLTLIFSGLVRILAGPLGLGLAIFGLFKTLKGIQELKEQNIINKIVKGGASKTIDEINRLQLAILELEASTTKTVATFSKTGKLTITSVKDEKEIERLNKRIKALQATLSMSATGPQSSFSGSLKDISDIGTKAGETVTNLENDINTLILGLGKKARTPEGLIEALAAFQLLVGDPKTNDDFKTYEENINKIYQAFGEKAPTDQLKELMTQIANVATLTDFDNAMESIHDNMIRGVITYDQYKDAIAKLEEAGKKLNPIFETFKDVISSAGETLGDDLANALVEGENALDSFKNMFKDMVKQMLAEAIKLFIIRALLSSIFGAFGYDVNFGATGSAISSVTKQKKATGGSVMKRQPYIVGENGPELFTPSVNGSITPNERLGGGGNQNVTYNINAIDVQSFQSMIARDKSFIHAVVTKAGNDMPSGRRF